MQLQVIEHEDELGRDDFAETFSSEDELDSLARKASANEGLRPVGSNSLTATQADQALLEAAMSSAVHHPNVVQTYHYRTLQPTNCLASDGVSRAVRVSSFVAFQPFFGSSKTWRLSQLTQPFFETSQTCRLTQLSHPRYMTNCCNKLTPGSALPILLHITCLVKLRDSNC